MEKLIGITKGVTDMQLLYLWTENYKQLFHSQEFNFGGPFRFHYEPSSGKLVVKPSPFHIEHFFTTPRGENGLTSQISNITAIIGENGTGKSSLLEYLLEFLTPEQNNHNLNTRHILAILQKREDGTEFLALYHSSSIHLDIEHPEKVVVDPKVLETSNLHTIPKIYFSNICDSKRIPASFGTMNVSTNHLMSQYLHTEENEEHITLDDYYLNETEQQILFIKSRQGLRKDRIQFKLPETITVMLAPSDLLISMNRNQNSHFVDYINYFVKLLSDVFKSEGSKYRFIRRILEHLIIEHYHNKAQTSKIALQNELLYINKEFHFLSGHEDSILNDYIIKRLEELALFLQGKVHKNDSFLRVLEQSTRLIEIISTLKQSELKDYSIELPLNDPKNVLERFLDSYHRSTRYDRFLQFTWRYLSSGEVALLNLFSRLYSTRFFINKPSNVAHKHILLLIDEGETYFHPQWQKQLVNNLVDYLPDIFIDKSIQVVMTSNSPFIASDLPKTNVIFLKKVNNRTISLNELEDQHQTFAANIHTLLAHSFFMQDGLMGTFAREKINEMIDLLVNKDHEEIIRRRYEVEALISIIGEPLIRNKLTQLLQEKLVFNGLSLEERVSWLEYQLATLKGGRP